MSDPGFSVDEFHSAVVSATSRVEPLPPLENSVKSTWWHDFVEWIDKQLAPMNLGTINLEWLSGILSVLAWIIGIMLAVYILYRLFKFYAPRLSQSSKFLASTNDLPTFNDSIAPSTARAQLRQLWRGFLENTNLSRATTPLEFWIERPIQPQVSLTPEWLYQRMFGHFEPSESDINLARLELESIARKGQ